MPEIRIPVGGTTPPAPALNQVSLYAKADKRFYMQDDTGAEVKLLTDESTLASLSAALPLTSTGGANPTIAINNVTLTTNGAMLYQDKVILDSATPLNTADQLVKRDALGNFVANEITATLNGTASNVVTVPALLGDVTTNGITNATTISAGVITDNEINASAAIAISKLAVDPRDRSTHTGTQLSSTISDFGTGIDSYLTTNSTIVDAMINATANIALSKLATDPLARANHTGTQTVSTISDFTAETNLAIGNYITANPITNAEIDASANIALSKLAVDPVDRANHTGTQLAATISDFSTAVQGEISGGNGIDVTSGVVTAEGTASRIVVGAGGIDIDSAYVGQTSITTLGTVTTGTWTGSTLSVAFGGTSATSAGEGLNNLQSLRTVSASDNLDENDGHILADANLAVVSLTLPSASAGNYRYNIKCIDATNNVVVTAAGGDTIEGNASYTLTTLNEYVTITSDAANTWYIFSEG